jgi:hypothetical protein
MEANLARDIVERLAAAGRDACAGAREDDDHAARDAIDSLTAIRLATKQAGIDAAVDFIERQGGVSTGRSSMPA